MRSTPRKDNWVTRPRDRQRKAVYRWEARVKHVHGLGECELSLDECKQIVDRVWADYTRPDVIPGPNVTDGRGRKSGGFAHQSWEIRLPKMARRDWYVLHEIAHSLMAHFRLGLAMHAPEFVGLYAELIEHYLGVPRRSLDELMESSAPGKPSVRREFHGITAAQRRSWARERDGRGLSTRKRSAWDENTPRPTRQDHPATQESPAEVR